MDPGYINETFSNNNLDKLTELLQQQPDLLNKPYQYGYRQNCLLDKAVSERKSQIVRLLLDLGADPDGIPDSRKSGDFPLARAISNCDISIMEILISQGADVKLVENYCSNYTFEHAISNTHNEVFELLYANGLDPSVMEKQDAYCLVAYSVMKARKDDCPIVKGLIDRGCQVHADRSTAAILKESDSSTSVLERLVYKGFSELIEYVLDKGVSVADLLPENRTMIQVLSVFGFRASDEIIECLLGGDYSENPENTRGYNAFFLAVKNDNVKILSLLLKHGADINQVQSNGDNALITAVYSGSIHVARYLVEDSIDLNHIGNGSVTVLEILRGEIRYMDGHQDFAGELEKLGARSSFDVINSKSGSEKEYLRLNKFIEAGEAWADQAIECLSKLNTDELAAWNVLLEHCVSNKSAKPSARWLKQATAMVDTIGPDDFISNLKDWLNDIGAQRSAGIKEYKVQDGRYDCRSEFFAISHNNTLLLKSLIWLSLIGDGSSEMFVLLKEVVRVMFAKIPDVGIRNAKIGNAALYALSMSDSDAAIAQIASLRGKAKYGPAKKYIDKVYREVAQRKNVTLDELDQMVRQSIQLTRMGEYEKAFGDFAAIIRLKTGAVSDLVWINGDKEQKTMPAAVKNEKKFAVGIKELKALKKEIDSLVTTSRFQLEQMYIRDISIDAAEWKTKYIEDYLMCTISMRLIWRVSDAGNEYDVLYVDGQFVSHQETSVEIADTATIKLWHPMMSDDDTVRALRDLVIKYGIVQPFKQAHREIYALSATEKSEVTCERFNGHIIRQHQFHALAEQRGWKQIRAGAWDGGDDASAWKVLPTSGLTVYLDAEPEEQLGSNLTLYEYLTTGAVYFYDHGETEVPVGQVNELILSEVFRDIDLFISVASVGNVPDWEYREAIDYWKKFGLGALSEIGFVRKSILESILPSLKHPDKYNIEGDYLIIDGHYQNYRIHIGSTCVLMGDEDRCLSLGTVRKRTFDGIPFEEDSALSKILSTAVMLADDNRIKDQDILAQINP